MQVFIRLNVLLNEVSKYGSGDWVSAHLRPSSKLASAGGLDDRTSDHTRLRRAVTG